MITLRRGICVLITLITSPVSWATQSLQLLSPDGKVELRFELDDSGTPVWQALHNKRTAIAPSRLGLTLTGANELAPGFTVAGIKRNQRDETYTLPVGKTRTARDHYNELTVSLQNNAKRKLDLIFRAFDDAIAIRYSIPKQDGLEKLEIASEDTEFAFSSDAHCWALPLKSFSTAYENDYVSSAVTELRHKAYIALPLTAKLKDGPHICITEANLKNYAGMYLHNSTTGSTTLATRLSPLPKNKSVCVRVNTPAESPWRVVLMSDQPAHFIESTTILNLNDPCAIADTSWIKPGKTAWDWWSGPAAPGEKFTPGTNNDTIKYFIDFASEFGLEYMLIDEGWCSDETNRRKKNWDNIDLTSTVPEVDLPMLIDYGRKHKVDLLLWMHWVPASTQMEKAFPFHHKLGIKGIKVDFMDRDDQEMVDWYHKVIKTAADNKLLINLHGAYKPTGLIRTYPNYVTQEGVMGAEYNKWSTRITATHNVTLPFTRMVAGPMDYTPGAFNNVTPQRFEKKSTEPMVMSTRAQQLAMYVVYESPVQMLCDYPGAYRGQAGAEFLKTVPSNWDETRALAGEVGQYVVVARRAGKRWFLGAMTNEQPRKLSVPLDFLKKKSAKITSFADGANATDNPKELTTATVEWKGDQPLEINLARAGGFAAIIE